MTPPNPFSTSSMPGSFLPAIPASLPSYPKHHNTFHTPQSPSPTLAPTRKRLQQRRPADTSSYTNQNDNDRDSDEDVMRNSLYSDTAFRTSLAAGSRKRGLADDDVDDYSGGGGKRVEATGDDGRPAKRRIIDVVGSVASRVWEFCISKTPFYSPQDDGMEFEREVQKHMGLYMPGQFSNSQSYSQNHSQNYSTQNYSSYNSSNTNNTYTNGGNGMGNTTQNNTYLAPTPTYTAPPPKPAPTGGLSSRWVMVSPTPAPNRPSTATYTSTTTHEATSRPYTAPNSSPHAPYNPTTYATTATSTTTATATPTTTSSSRSRRNSAATPTTAPPPRRPATRPIVARAKRPAVVRHKHASSTSSPAYPAPPSQSAFTFGGGGGGSPARASLANTRSRRKLTGGSISRGASFSGGSFNGIGIGGVAPGDEEEDEADESIRRFNEKLKDMIREGREALGSKIEVTYDDDDFDGF